MVKCVGGSVRLAAKSSKQKASKQSKIGYQFEVLRGSRRRRWRMHAENQLQMPLQIFSNN